MLNQSFVFVKINEPGWRAELFVCFCLINFYSLHSGFLIMLHVLHLSAFKSTVHSPYSQWGGNAEYSVA